MDGVAAGVVRVEEGDPATTVHRAWHLGDAGDAVILLSRNGMLYISRDGGDVELLADLAPVVPVSEAGGWGEG